MSLKNLIYLKLKLRDNFVFEINQQDNEKYCYEKDKDKNK